MGAKQYQIRQLQAACLRLDEKELARAGNEIINSLRGLYLSKKEDFEEGDIKTILNCKNYIAAAEDLLLELEDFSFIQDQQDVNNITARLLQYSNLNPESVISRRIRKEIRELESKRPSLPTGQANARKQKLKAATRTLDAHAPKCGHRGCESSMTLREGNGEYFWGCRSFPECLGKRRLTSTELALLPD